MAGFDSAEEAPIPLVDGSNPASRSPFNSAVTGVPGAGAGVLGRVPGKTSRGPAPARDELPLHTPQPPFRPLRLASNSPGAPARKCGRDTLARPSAHSTS